MSLHLKVLKFLSAVFCVLKAINTQTKPQEFKLFNNAFGVIFGSPKPLFHQSEQIFLDTLTL